MAWDIARCYAWICRQSSRKAIFFTVLVVCILGIGVMYILDIHVVSSQLEQFAFWKLALLKRWQNQRFVIISNQSNIETDNSSTALTVKEFPYSKIINFNATAVHCKESPYVECFPPNSTPQLKPGKIFKIGYLLAPGDLREDKLDLSLCEFKQCVIDAEHVTNDTDIVVVDGWNLRDDLSVPLRMPHQLYFTQVWESPVHIKSDFIANGQSPWNNRINVIMTYRNHRGSFFPYGKLRYRPKPLNERPNYYEIAKNKTKTAVWIVSNCVAPSQRNLYVKQMLEYVDIDIYGKCGQQCSGATWLEGCDNYQSKYKFYLAFENSLCTDYVTEKYFKLFKEDIFVIPVVRGAFDYDKYFPDFTYINAAHFDTPKDLALYLKYLAADLETYSQYLEHKDLYGLVSPISFACQMCTYLHTHELPEPSDTVNITSWLGVEHCHTPTDL
ncbi:hypothetical protein BsWGS_13492 [Bradybaena similaris]